MDDNLLIGLIKNGDRSAFIELYNIYSESVYNIAFRYVKNIQSAEEITQDVFLSIHRNASKFRGNAAVRTWIYRIAVNTSLNAIKKNRNHNNTLEVDSSYNQLKTDKNGLSLMIDNEAIDSVLYEIDLLSDREKTTIILSYIEDLPRQEVADIMQLSLKAVESLLQRAKGKLRERLNKKYPDRRIIK